MIINRQYYCMRFYITYRCNSKCNYCNVWQDERFCGKDELAPEEAERLVKQCYEVGVRYMDITGGEPTLSHNLTRLIKYAKGLGIKTEVTTNAASGCTYNLMEVARLADKFNISLDTLDRATYKKIRGINCLDCVTEAVDEVTKIRPPKLMMVVTKDNVEKLDEMINYAQGKNAEIYLNPVFSYFDEKNSRVQVDWISKIIFKIFERNTVVMLHFLEFFRESGGKNRPSCSANSRTLTFAPNGDMILPCYHELRETIPWRGSLSDMLCSATFRKYEKISGTTDYCKDCVVVPYFGISFNYKLDSWFLLQSYSEKLHHLKLDFLNQISELKWSGAQLKDQLEELLNVIRSLELPLQKETEWLYWPKERGNGYWNLIYRKPLTLEQYRDMSEAMDCWHLKLVPHYGFDLIYNNVYRKAYELYCEGNFKDAYIRIFQDSMEFQLRWWKFYISDYMRPSRKCDIETERSWILDYLNFLMKWGNDNALPSALKAVEELMRYISYE